MRKIFTKSSYFILLLFLCGFTLIGNAQQTKPQVFKGPIVFINLMYPSADSLLLVDGTAAMYANNFSNSVDEYDAGKLSNFNENICLMRDGQKLAIEARKIPVLFNDTLFINMWGMKKQAYALQIVPKNLSLMPVSGAWLHDKYLNKETPLNLFDKTVYGFTSTADTNSYKNRFFIVFDKKTLIAKPVSLNKQSSVNGKIAIYPNPLSGSIIKVAFVNMGKDNYSVELSNLSGKILINKNIVHPGGSSEYYINLNNVYSPGIYSIIISGKNAEKAIHLPLIIN